MTIPFGRHIISLLKEHECVVLPELGALLLKNIPAHIAAGQIFPAGKKVVFNHFILSEDNLLESALVNHNNYSFLEARLEVQKFVSLIKFELTQKGFFQIENLGRFSSINNELTFVSNSNLGQLNKENFGFENIAVFAIPREIIREKDTKKPVSEKVLEDSTSITSSKPTVSKNTRSIRKGSLVGFVASVLFIIAISVLMITETNFSNLKVQNAHVLNFIVPSSSLIQKEDTTGLKRSKKATLKAKSEEKKAYKKLAKEEKNSVKNDTKPEDVSVNQTTAINIEDIDPEYREILKVNTDNPSGYYIIIGAYSDLANANKAKYECSLEYVCNIFQTSTGMYRVGIYASQEMLEAIDSIKAMRKTNTTYWLMENIQ